MRWPSCRTSVGLLLRWGPLAVPRPAGRLLACAALALQASAAGAAPLPRAPDAALHAVVLAPVDAPRADAPAVLELAISDAAGQPWSGAVPALRSDAGTVGALTAVGPGRWRFVWSGPAGVPSFVADVDGRSVQTRGPEVRALETAASLRAGEAVDATTDDRRIAFAFGIPDGKPVPTPAELVVRASEGRVLETRVEGRTLRVDVEPGADRTARTLVVGVLDRRAPDAVPVWALARVRARPQLSLVAEPGNVATLRVGRRTFGPFVADAAGVLTVGFEAMPGDTSYEVLIRDDVGNMQRAQGPLPTPPAPAVVGLETPDAAAAGAWVAAFSASGEAWSAAAPSCRGAAAGAPRRVAPGVWRVALADHAASASPFDVRLDCSVGGATTTLRLPRPAPAPARIDLRVYPDAIRAEFPLAEVQATLLSADGARLPVDGLRLRADHGDLATDVREAALLAEYRGERALAEGGDRLVASWDAPLGAGAPWRVDVYATSRDGSVEVVVRTRDRDGRALPSIPVHVVTEDDEGAVRIERDVVTDARGWAALSAPADRALMRVRAETGVVGAGAAVFRGLTDLLPDPEAPDLVAEVQVPVRAGRARSIDVGVSPRVLLTGAGDEALVVVRLVDAGGTLVRDEPVRVSADVGAVGPPEARPDGTFAARYTPPRGVVARDVRIEATSSSGTASAVLRLEPRPVRGTAALGVGWLTNFGGIASPTLSLGITSRLPVLPELLSARVSMSGHRAHAHVDDPLAGGAVDVSATLVPVELGVQFTQRSGRRALDAGVGALLTPYLLSADFGGSGYSGVAIGAPGLVLHGGGGWRIGSAEAFVEARWLLIPGGNAAVRFDAPLGGGAALAGYRVLW